MPVKAGSMREILIELQELNYYHLTEQNLFDSNKKKQKGGFYLSLFNAFLFILSIESHGFLKPSFTLYSCFSRGQCVPSNQK